MTHSQKPEPASSLVRRGFKVWKQPGGGGPAIALLRELENLRNVVPDCEVCSRRVGTPVLADSVRWWMRGGVYVVTVECHGEKEQRRIPAKDMDGVERVLVLPAFRELAIQLRAPQWQRPVPAWLLKTLLGVTR